jgi:chromosome segregation ATPase
MTGIFHRRKGSTSTSTELDTHMASLHQQTHENTLLKEKIQDLKDAAGQNKATFESLMRENEEQEKKIQELKVKNSELQEKVREQESVLKNLREVKFQLATDKDLNNPQMGSVKEVQDLLSLADGSSEILIFKDMNGATWELKKMPQK